MRRTIHSAAAGLVLALISVPALAEGADAHAGHAGAAAFPEVCRSAAAPVASGHDMAGAAALTFQHQRDSMAGMMAMDCDMAQGMMKDDADVAFICGMIAHHRGAIDMAAVELKHGRNAWARTLARRIIAAQTKEIADMTRWLKDNAK